MGNKVSVTRMPSDHVNRESPAQFPTEIAASDGKAEQERFLKPVPDA